MAELVASNLLLKSQASNVRSSLVGSFLRLYYNNPSRSPANVQSDFAEAYFAGYVPQQFVNWGSVTKQKDGEYGFYSPIAVFVCNALPNLVVNGWYLTTTDGLQFSNSFSSPIAMFPGATLSIQLLITAYATMLLVP